MFHLLLMVLAAIALSSPCSAHVPILAEGNLNISNAVDIYDPTKSWAVYGSIQPNSSHYYRLDFYEKDPIYLSLLRSAAPEEKSFQPGLILIGPGLNRTGQIPEQVKLPGIPADWGYEFGVQSPEGNAAFYEPFGPSSYVEISTINNSSPRSGKYFAVVFSRQTAGHYSLAIGTREEFGFMERITLPLRLVSVYLWEGQSLGTIIIPYITAIAAALLIFYKSKRRTPFSLAGSLAGFLFLATSASVISQCIFNLTRAPFGSEVYITLGFAVFHCILGVFTIRLARGEAGILQRILLAVAGTIGMLAGSGMLIGPVLAILASFLASMKAKYQKPAPYQAARQ